MAVCLIHVVQVEEAPVREGDLEGGDNDYLPCLTFHSVYVSPFLFGLSPS
jgi:hypothetical protein